jgi:hypothetical protein
MERAFLLLDNSNEFIECIRKILHYANDLERNIYAKQNCQRGYYHDY